MLERSNIEGQGSKLRGETVVVEELIICMSNSSSGMYQLTGRLNSVHQLSNISS